MSQTAASRTFIGRGNLTGLQSRVGEINPWNDQIGPWKARESVAETEEAGGEDHPQDYEADAGLVNAVNVALILRRPLLLTGNPGTGKSQLADRVAWEFNLSPVLRFEAQSSSEAGELFYRFDLVGRLAQVYMSPDAKASAEKEAISIPTSQVIVAGAADARRFLSYTALGKAILYANPMLRNGDLDSEMERVFPVDDRTFVHPAPPTGRQSVVLIDEIDKTSRDFPNDLLNALDRFEFRVREIENRIVTAPRDKRPIVIITSNSERELPGPFLRRCVYYHIPDPGAETLKRIVGRRVFPDSIDESGSAPLDKLFAELIDAFVKIRDDKTSALQYRAGTAELLDLSRVLAASAGIKPGVGLAGNLEVVYEAVSAMAKSKGDAETLGAAFKKHAGPVPAPA